MLGSSAGIAPEAGRGRTRAGAAANRLNSKRKDMVIKVLYFGRLKEFSGAGEESVEVREGARIEDLFSQCSAKRPELQKFRSSLVAARNCEFASWDAELRGGDEVGFLPPVSGG